jgi:plastocyanin
MKLAIVAIALATLTVISHADTSDTLAANTVANVGNFWFCNSSFQNGVCPTTVQPGDTITWNWVVSFTHNTTSCTDGTFSNCNGQEWASPNQSSGTFVHQFNSTGTFFYQCTLHPTQMRGRIDVIQDTDGDGWSDATESIIGTDPLDACPDNTSDNAWPPDINNDRLITFGDIGLLTGIFGQTGPPARRDLAPEPPDGLITFADIGRQTSIFGQACGP